MEEIARKLHGLAARVRSNRLDRTLAHGADARSDRLLAARAEQLTSRQSRDSLIAVLRADLDEATWFHSQEQVGPRKRQRELFKAKAELQQLIDRLGDDKEVSARGIARLRRLATDHLGPMYGYGPPGTLPQVLNTALQQLHANDRQSNA